MNLRTIWFLKADSQKDTTSKNFYPSLLAFVKHLPKDAEMPVLAVQYCKTNQIQLNFLLNLPQTCADKRFERFPFCDLLQNRPL